MEKKHVVGGILVVVAIVGVLVYPSVRFALFTFRARGTIEKLPRFAEAPQILGLADAIKADAAHHRLDPAKVTVRLALEERGMMGTDIMFTFILVTVTDGERTWSYSAGSQAGRRIETPIERLLPLEQAGVEIRRAAAPEPAAEGE